jgi:NAD(P)H-nitrite reductase large subunit
MSKKYKYLIIGNSSSAIGCIEGIREIDRENEIAVFSKEPYFAYSRPIITYYLCGDVPFENIYLRPSDFYEKNNIDVFLKCEVKKIDFKNKLIFTEYDKIFYENLLIATGSNPIIPDIKGKEKEGVFTFTKLEDAQKVKERVESEKIKKVCILGGGLIGLKVAESFKKLGISVFVVELADRILSPVLDETASEIIKKVFVDNGIEIITSTTIFEIIGKTKNSKKVGGVILSNGKKISSDLVILAIGVRPNLSLVENTEIEIERGILVDRFMRTNIENVYAAGDVADVYDFVEDKNRNILTLPNAYCGGRVAGFNMAGRNIEYDFGCGMNSVSFFGISCVSFGIIYQGEEDEVLTKRNEINNSYKKIILRDDFVKGAIFVQDIDRCGIIFGLMKNRIKITDFKDKILSNEFGLIYFPENLRKEMLNEGFKQS